MLPVRLKGNNGLKLIDVRYKNEKLKKREQISFSSYNNTPGGERDASEIATRRS